MTNKTIMKILKCIISGFIGLAANLLIGIAIGTIIILGLWAFNPNLQIATAGYLFRVIMIGFMIIGVLYGMYVEVFE